MSIKIISKKALSDLNTRSFISFKDNKNKLSFLAIENGRFYRMNKNSSYERLKYGDLLEVLFGLSDKHYKIVGFGHYGKSILTQIQNQKEVI